MTLVQSGEWQPVKTREDQLENEIVSAVESVNAAIEILEEWVNRAKNGKTVDQSEIIELIVGLETTVDDLESVFPEETTEESK